MTIDLAVVNAGLILALTAPEHGAPRVVAKGRWGSRLAALVVTSRHARLQLPCGQGRMPAPLPLDAAGRFEVEGTYQALTAVPHPGSGSPAEQKARYSGRSSGRTLELSFTVPDGTEFGPFPLARGSKWDVPSCVAGPPPRERNRE